MHTTTNEWTADLCLLKWTPGLLIQLAWQGEALVKAANHAQIVKVSCMAASSRHLIPLQTNQWRSSLDDFTVAHHTLPLHRGSIHINAEQTNM